MYAAKYYADDIVNNGSFEFTLKDLEDDGLIDLKGKCSNKTNALINYAGGYDFTNIRDGDCASDKIGN